MQLRNSHLIYSASDLAAFSLCGQRTWLDARALHGGPRAPKFDNPTLDALSRLGDEHEAAYLRKLQAEGLSVAIIESWDREKGERPPGFLEAQCAETLAHMKNGVEIIHQATVFDGTWIGYIDFLIKVDRPSALGAWSYEVVDAKLARSAKPQAIIQVCLYSAMIASMQELTPEHIHLYLGRKIEPLATFELSHFAALYRDLKKRFLAHVEARPDELPVAVDPVEFCQICKWSKWCRDERTAADHLTGVAGLSRRHLAPLRDSNTATMRGLAERPLASRPDDIAEGSYHKIREQARVQVAGRDAGSPVWEFLETEGGRGLQALPAPDPADWFFDFEGAPLALDDGLEYLWGVSDTADEYEPIWALSRAEEKATLISFLTRAVETLAAEPGFHIYHFAPYETTALKKLVARHGVGTAELDLLLRNRVFVDLHRITVQAIRASVTSYSIKKLEAVYGFARDVSMDVAGPGRARLEAEMTFGRFAELSPEDSKIVEGYNRDDCISTRRLRDWLEERRTEVVDSGRPVPRPVIVEEKEKEDDTQAEVTRVISTLLEGVPDERAERDPAQQVAWLAAHLVEWHRREAKGPWWEFFNWRDNLSIEELIEESRPLAGLWYLGKVEDIKQSERHRFGFPPQDFKLDIGKTVRDRDNKKDQDKYLDFTVLEFDEDACTVDLKVGPSVLKVWDPAKVRAILPETVVRTPDQAARLFEAALCLLEGGAEGLRAANPVAHSLLNVERPSFQGGVDPLSEPGEPLDRARRAALSLQRSVLPVQGPPGTGKTYSGARMITALLREGRRVGITAPSHKSISNLIEEVCKAAKEAGVRLEGLQASPGEEGAAYDDDRIEVVNGSGPARDAFLAEGSTHNLLAGTAWLWAGADMRNAVDVLFVDEAGQVSLANAVAISHAAEQMILLGDPQQLNQPQKGMHPEGAEASALEHLIGPSGVMTAARGLFLDQTYRMRKEIAAFTSELFYRGNLKVAPETERQALTLASGDVIPGLHLRTVPHSGRTRESEEEALAVAELCAELLDGGQFTNSRGEVAELRPEQLRIVAPYNAQVSRIRSALLAAGIEDVKVGTVDKFQGQNAPVAIYSLASSSADDAPRGMSFLYALDRLNVATSRARVATWIVASTQVFGASCSTPQQMRELNAFLRFREMAK